MRNNFYQGEVWTSASGVTKLLSEMTTEHLWNTKEMLRIKADWLWGKLRGEVLAKLRDIQSGCPDLKFRGAVSPVKRPPNWPTTTPLYNAICRELLRRGVAPGRSTVVDSGQPLNPPPYSLPTAPIGDRIGQRIADTDEVFEQEFEEWAEERMPFDDEDFGRNWWKDLF